MLTSELGELKEDDFSKLLTLNDVLDCPKKVEYWQSFDGIMEKFNKHVKNVKAPTYEKYIQAEIEQKQVVCHHQLVTRFENHCKGTIY